MYFAGRADRQRERETERPQAWMRDELAPGGRDLNRKHFFFEVAPLLEWLELEVASRLPPKVDDMTSDSRRPR